MHPEESENAISKYVAFFAYKTYKETGKIIFDKFGDDFTPNEEIFALMATITDCAVYCEVPIDHLISNLKMMYTAKLAANQINCEGAANDTTH
jgi:hypothetical protein